MIYSADVSFFILTQQSWGGGEGWKQAPPLPPHYLLFCPDLSRLLTISTQLLHHRSDGDLLPPLLISTASASSTAERERERQRERGKDRNMEGNRTHCPLPFHWLPSLPLPILYFPFSHHHHHHPCSSRYELREIISDTSELPPSMLFAVPFLAKKNRPPPPLSPSPPRRKETNTPGGVRLWGGCRVSICPPNPAVGVCGTVAGPPDTHTHIHTHTA